MLASLKVAMTMAAANGARRSREQEDAATAAAGRAAEAVAASERAFDRHRRQGFAPETGALYASALLHAQAALGDADRRTDSAGAERADHERRWTLARAEEEAVAALAKRLVRTDRRRREEAQLAAAADLVTFRRMRP